MNIGPLLNPRTFRHSADEDPKVEHLCPVPQMVGGGTVHWTGWVPRMTVNEFCRKTLHGKVTGPSLADWPITYEKLEPYYGASNASRRRSSRNSTGHTSSAIHTDSVSSPDTAVSRKPNATRTCERWHSKVRPDNR